jgi:hypothetical protein
MLRTLAFSIYNVVANGTRLPLIEQRDFRIEMPKGWNLAKKQVATGSAIHRKRSLNPIEKQLL